MFTANTTLMLSARLRFTLCATAMIGFQSAASGAVLTYEMIVAPDSESTPMTRSGDGFGDQTAGDFGPPRNAGLQGDGTARFVDSGTNGKDGYFINGLGATYTIDMRVLANSGVLPGSGNDRRSMGIQDGFNGRGVLIEPGGLTLVTGTGPVGGGTASVNLASYHMVRITVAGGDGVTTGQATIYDLENDLDAGPGFNWAVLAGPVNLGGSGNDGSIDGLGGGIHLNTLDVSNGGSVQNSDFNLDWLRIETGVNRGATQGIIPAPVVTCAAGVTPATTQTRIGFENGIAPAVDPVDYTFNNLSANPVVGYSVTEATNVAAPTDYPWLTLTNASGNIAGNSNVTVTANIDTTTLAAGSYTAYLKFDDTCPNGPCFTEGFTYPNGALAGVGGWTGNAQADDIAVNNNEVEISANVLGGDAGDVRVTHDVGCSPDGDGVISVRAKLRSGLGDSFIADLRAFDGAGATGNVLGWWRFSGTHIAARTVVNAGLVAVNPIPAAPTDFEMRIYTADKVTEYYANNVLIATFPHPPGASTAVASVDLARIDRTDVPNDFVFVDDIDVTVTERHIRRIDLTVKGCELQVQQPSTRSLGSCDSSSQTTEVFTVKNTGAYDWTGFQATEFNDDDDWLTLSFNSQPVPRNGTATVTATIDWSAAPVTIPGDDLIGVIRFSATCNGVDFVHDTPPNTITINDNLVKPPLVFKYEGDVAPSDPNSGGPGFNFVLLSDGSVDQGSIVSDVGLDGALDGLAYRIVDTGAAKTKWRVDPSAQDLITNAAGATVVARVKTLSAAGSPSGNLFIYANADGGSSNGVSAAAHWAGPGNQVVDADRGISAAVPGDDKYHIIRLTSQVIPGSGNVIRIYVDENPVPALEVTNASSVGSSAGSLLESIGFGAGSTGGTQEVYFDCVYGTSAGAFAPGDEDDCIGSMVCVPDCNIPFADADPVPEGDGDVDINDFALFQRCYTGPNFAGVLSPECACFDKDSTGGSAGSVDNRDFLKFEACGTGANVPWAPSIACP